MTRALVCGGRDYRDRFTFETTMEKVHKHFRLTAIVEGGAQGADTFARGFAIRHNIPCETYHADWKTKGRSAGPIRNRQMIEKDIGLVVAFPGGAGTTDMVRVAKSRGVKLIEVV